MYVRQPVSVKSSTGKTVVNTLLDYSGRQVTTDILQPLGQRKATRFTDGIDTMRSLLAHKDRMQTSNSIHFVLTSGIHDQVHLAHVIRPLLTGQAISAFL